MAVVVTDIPLSLALLGPRDDLYINISLTTILLIRRQHNPCMGTVKPTHPTITSRYDKYTNKLEYDTGTIIPLSTDEGGEITNSERFTYLLIVQKHSKSEIGGRPTKQTSEKGASDDLEVSDLYPWTTIDGDIDGT